VYKDEQYKHYAIQVAKLSKGAALYIAGDVPLDPLLSFYMTREKNEIIVKGFDQPPAGSYYIIKPDENMERKYPVIYRFRTQYDNMLLLLVKV
jgi:hypothetical protein